MMNRITTNVVAVALAFGMTGTSWAQNPWTGHPWAETAVRFLPSAIFDIDNDGEVNYNVDAAVITYLWEHELHSIDADIASPHPTDPTGFLLVPDGVVNGKDLTAMRAFESHFDVTGNVAVLIQSGVNDNKVNIDDVQAVLDYVTYLENGGTLDEEMKEIMDLNKDGVVNVMDADLLWSRFQLSPWRNWKEQTDINGDDSVTSLDQLIIMSNYVPPNPLVGVISKTGGPFLDVDGDFSFSSIDRLIFNNNYDPIDE